MRGPLQKNVKKQAPFFKIRAPLYWWCHFTELFKVWRICG